MNNERPSHKQFENLGKVFEIVYSYYSPSCLSGIQLLLKITQSIFLFRTNQPNSKLIRHIIKT